MEGIDLHEIAAKASSIPDQIDRVSFLCENYYMITTNHDLILYDRDEINYISNELFHRSYGVMISISCEMMREELSSDFFKEQSLEIVVDKIFEIGRRIKKLKESEDINQFEKSVESYFNNSFSIEFTDGDIDRLQQLINEMREFLASSEFIEEGHKLRLLKKLEKLQSELHKKMSSVDACWGLMGDAGAALGKFGKDVKPFTDRVREFLEIVWRSQARAEELPSSAKLPKLEDSSEK